MSAAGDVRRFLAASARADARAARMRSKLDDAVARFTRERGYYVPLQGAMLLLELDKVSNPSRTVPHTARGSLGRGVTPASRSIAPAVEAGRGGNSQVRR